MKPKDVKTLKDVCSLRRDNWSAGGFCIGFNSAKHLYIFEQKIGEKAKQTIEIPLFVFNRFAKVFNANWSEQSKKKGRK